MGEWRECLLGDLCDEGVAELRTGPFGSQLHAYDYVEAGVPVVPTEAIRDRKINHRVLPKITERKANELARHRLKPGDILFARRGAQATGHIAFVRVEEGRFICGTGAIRLRLTDPMATALPAYLSHVFANPASVAWFKFHAIGATMPNLNEGIIRSFPLSLPPPNVQAQIAELLSALDDKIELNRRMNGTLERQARALFRDWFVDFGPTRAKMAGGVPYLAPEIWSLFPDRLDDEGKPEEWEMGTLANIAETNAKSWTVRNHPDEVEYVDLSNTKWGVIETTTKLTWEKAPSRARRITRIGDTIVATTRPGNGSFAYISRNGLTASTGFAVLTPKEQVYRDFIYIAATIPDNIKRLANLADGHGGAYPAVKPSEVSDAAIVLPRLDVMEAFAATVSAMQERIELNKQESRTLARARDLLLPKLMSGEIRVREAEGIVGGMT